MLPCKACRSPIRFLTTEKGRRLPINDEPVTVTAGMAADGPVRLVDQAGHFRAHEVGETGYVSHFATCPEAGAFRRKSAPSSPAPAPKAKSLSDVQTRVKYLADAVNRLARLGGRVSREELKHLARYADTTLTMLEGLR